MLRQSMQQIDLLYEFAPEGPFDLERFIADHTLWRSLPLEPTLLDYASKVISAVKDFNTPRAAISDVIKLGGQQGVAPPNYVTLSRQPSMNHMVGLPTPNDFKLEIGKQSYSGKPFAVLDVATPASKLASGFKALPYLGTALDVASITIDVAKGNNVEAANTFGWAAFDAVVAPGLLTLAATGLGAPVALGLGTLYYGYRAQDSLDVFDSKWMNAEEGTKTLIRDFTR